jgi:hypothetical protein
MDARMSTLSTINSRSDPSAFELRKAAILRDGALPNAPLAMPRQVIELPRVTVVDSAERGLRRAMSVIAHSFGFVARGRS